MMHLICLCHEESYYDSDGRAYYVEDDILAIRKSRRVMKSRCCQCPILSLLFFRLDDISSVVSANFNRQQLAGEFP